MQEPARIQRNKDRLAECFPAFAKRLRRALSALEAQGFRPRIQDAWRSPEAQEQAFVSGHSQLRFGFHNVTGAGGAKESLACDVLDDDNPLNPRKRYLLALTIACRAEGLDTGLLWGLPKHVRDGVEAALAAGDIEATVKIGWDPTHAQATGLTPAEAKAGTRPA